MATAEEIEELIPKLQKERNMASIIVTHDLHGARTLADRLALLHEGNVMIEGSFDDLEKSDDEFVSRFLGRNRNHRLPNRHSDAARQVTRRKAKKSRQEVKITQPAERLNGAVLRDLQT